MTTGVPQAVMLSVEVYPGGERVSGVVDHLVVAGYTGRDPKRVQTHIDELARQGISPPPAVPMFYPVPAGRLVAKDRIKVDGSFTSGEVEPVLVRLGGRRFVGVGSDHTDRTVERTDVPASKVACPKVIAPIVFDYEFAVAEWDTLRLSSWVGTDRLPYQAGSAGDLRQPAELSELGPLMGDGSVMFMGTVPLLSHDFVDSDRFELEMSTASGNGAINWAYQVERSD